MMVRVAALVALVLVAGPAHLSIAGQTPSESAGTCASVPADDSSYRLQVGDVLEIAFRFTPELNASPTIRPDGRIAVSGAGEVSAKGLTTRQLTCVLQEAYRGFLRDPIISVSVRNFETPSFIVGGEVARPGRFELRGDTTIREAITVAGGFTRSAKRSEVYLFRRAGSDGAVEPRLFDVRAILEKGQLAEDVLLEPGDMLFVPQTGFSKIERFVPVPGFGFFLSGR